MPDEDRHVLQTSLYGGKSSRQRLSPELVRSIAQHNGQMDETRVLAALEAGHTVCTSFNAYVLEMVMEKQNG